MSQGTFEDDYDALPGRGATSRGWGGGPDPSGVALTPEELLAWGTARAGLGLNLAGGILTSVGVGLLALLILTLVGQGPRFGRGGNDFLLEFSLIGLELGLIFLVVGALLTVAGILQSSGASRASGAAGWSLASRVVLLLIPLTVLGLQLWADRPGDDLRQLMTLATNLEAGVLLFLFVMYLRKVSLHLGRSGTAQVLTIYLAVSELLLVGSTLLQLERGPGNAELTPYLLLAATGLSIWFTILVAGVRGGLTAMLLQSLRRQTRR